MDVVPCIRVAAQELQLVLDELRRGLGATFSCQVRGLFIGALCRALFIFTLLFFQSTGSEW
jgi:hypothetical protein